MNYRVVPAMVALLLAGLLEVSAQPSRIPLDPGVITSVERLYPGFGEILERGDSMSLERLARVLSANPSEESLSMLLWMLQCCAAGGDVVQIGEVVRAVGRLPLAPFAGGLTNDDPDRRITAAVVLSDGEAYVSAGERDLFVKVLIAALSDPNVRVREVVAASVRALQSPAGDAALARALTGPDVTDMLFWRATGQKRPFAPANLTEASFPRETVAAVRAIAPRFLQTLNTREDSSVRELIAAIEHARHPDTTPVLAWLLAHGDSPAYGDRLVYRLAESPYIQRLPVAELSQWLSTTAPDNRLAIADLFGRVLESKAAPPTRAVRDLMVAALVDRFRDPIVRRLALDVLLRAGSPDAERGLIAALDRGEVPNPYPTLRRALSASGRQAVLARLERIARTRGSQSRETAVRAYLDLADPPDVDAERRRLLWEPPDTDLERAVLAQGSPALPLAWKAVTSGSDGERRAAAALLGWFRDRNSIGPILTALDGRLGALTREQLLFDLNMILLTEGAAPDAVDRNALAAAHLRWLYGELAQGPVHSDIRAAVLSRNTIAVFPDRVVAPFSITLSSRTPVDAPRGPSRAVSATAVRLDSAEAFLESVSGDGCGVAFHAITAANGVARVATTVYLPHGRIVNQVWISLYRREGDGWVQLHAPSHPHLQRSMNEPNLLPTISRNYGADDPLTVLRLDLTMERIRVDRKASSYLQSEKHGPRGLAPIDASYAGLLERYRHSDSPSVRYTAEYEWGNLTGQPNLDLWLDTLSAQPSSPFQDLAIRVVRSYAVNQLTREGREVAGAERDDLIAAALAPKPVDARLLPQRLPRAEEIRAARRSNQFALVTVRLGSSGYSMLFHRRGERWVFLFMTDGWIS